MLSITITLTFRVFFHQICIYFLSVNFPLVDEYLDVSIKVARDDHLPLLLLLADPLLASCLPPPLHSLQDQLWHRSKQ